MRGKVYDDWQSGEDYDASTPDYFMPGNYTQKGKEWEREATMQVFEDGQLAVTQNVGIRIHGGATRSYPQKSFKVFARKEYGAVKLEYDLFSGNGQPMMALPLRCSIPFSCETAEMMRCIPVSVTNWCSRLSPTVNF